MNAAQDFQLFFQAIFLCNAIFWTCAYINVLVGFTVKAMSNRDATITKTQLMLVAFSWAIFFWLMRAQF